MENMNCETSAVVEKKVDKEQVHYGYKPMDFKLTSIEKVPEFYENLIEIELTNAVEATNNLRDQSYAATLMRAYKSLELNAKDYACTNEELSRCLDLAMEAPVGDADGKGMCCAAICAYPKQVNNLIEYKRGKGEGCSLKIASVAYGYPHSQIRKEVAIKELEKLAQFDLDEIDITARRRMVNLKQWKLLYLEIAELKALLPEKIRVKTILVEEDLRALTDLYKCCVVTMLAGTDFICLSSGHVDKTVPYRSVYVTCKAIAEFHERTGRCVGIKICGKVDLPHQGVVLLHLIKQLLGEAWLSPDYVRIAPVQSIESVLQNLNEIASSSVNKSHSPNTQRDAQPTKLR